MPVDTKPLFRADAVRPRLAKFSLPPNALAARPKLTSWSDLLASKQAETKETELLADFLRDVFVSLLGYVPPPETPYSIKREALVKVDGKFADAGFGHFNGGKDVFAAVLEGKGPRDPLDRPFSGRKRSAVEQALQYAVQLQIDWYLVTNLKEVRLYHKGHDTFTCERFETARLATEEPELKRFVYVLGAERVLAPSGNHLDGLLTESKKIGRELTNDYYREFRALRESTFEALKQQNPQQAPAVLLAATQKMLDRVLFIAFCEDRGLLPSNIIARAYEHSDPFNRRPVWENFVGLFRSIDSGNDRLNVAKYNGGLFRTDPFLEGLIVPDAVCEGFRKLADYEYGNDAEAEARLIDVEILGHIFEQSISDLEEMQNRIAGLVKETKSKEQKKTTRKETGAFYTPAFITRYIVAETLGPVLAERSARLRAAHEEAAAKTIKKVLADPAVFDPKDLTKPQTAALVKFWEAWIDELETVRIVDPACGSGAFLLEAFDQLFAEYEKTQGFLTELQGATLFDIRKTILERNLYGMDLNGEAIEIARLSCWIKTAELHKVLTSLDDNIKQGNSVVAEPSPLEAWRARFPTVFAEGGFDVVIGNPPYVRQEWISPSKPFLQQHYKAYDGTADLYVYFYELGVNLLRPGGRLGFVVTNKWMKAGYGEPLRRFLGEESWVQQVVDFGHAKQIFPDADVFPSILIVRKPLRGVPPATARVCAIPREQLRIDDLSRQIEADGFVVPRARFGGDPWTLEPPRNEGLLEKIGLAAIPLTEFAGAAPLYGVKTGLNEAFIVDTATRDRLIAEHSSSRTLLRKYLRGQDIERWSSSWSGEWMLFVRRGTAIEKYPAIKRHLEQYRIRLEPKPRGWEGQRWEGRKQGSYPWYELQDSIDYWQEFAKPKVLYQDLAWNPRFCFDTDGVLTNNTIYFIPTPDLWVLAVLNAPISWWFAWRRAQRGKDETLRLFNTFMQCFPIPRPTDEQRATVEEAVRQLINLAQNQQSGRKTLLDWLRLEFGVEKPSQKLQDTAALTPDTLVTEVKKSRGKTKPLSSADVKRLKDEHAASIVPLQANAVAARELEYQVSALVNAAYGLTPDEERLMWQTAPPRMPLPPPRLYRLRQPPREDE